MILATTMLVEAWRWIDLRIPADLFDAASYNLIISLGRSAAPMISIFFAILGIFQGRISPEKAREGVIGKSTSLLADSGKLPTRSSLDIGRRLRLSLRPFGISLRTRLSATVWYARDGNFYLTTECQQGKVPGFYEGVSCGVLARPLQVRISSTTTFSHFSFLNPHSFSHLMAYLQWWIYRFDHHHHHHHHSHSHWKEKNAIKT